MNKKVLRYTLFVIYIVVGCCNLMFPWILIKYNPQLFDNAKNNKSVYIIYAVTVLFFMLTIFAVYKVISKVNTENKIKNEYKKSLDEFQAEYEKYLQLKNECTQLHKIKHDINNILNQATVLNMANDDSAKEKGQKLVSSLKAELDKLDEFNTEV